MKNDFQITKTIRFKLKPENISLLNDNIEKQDKFSLSSFVMKLNNYIDEFNDYMFYKKDEDFKIKDKLLIKNEWIRMFQKQEYAELLAKKKANNYKRVQITIGDISGLTSIIEETLDNVDSIYAELATDASAGLNERAKRARIALLLKRLSTKNVLPYLVSLIENVTDKNEIGDLSLKLKRDGIKLLEQLQIGIQEYLPEQSSGLPIAKASFNYYTINKSSVDYDGKIKELKKKFVFDLDDKKSELINIKKEIKEDIRKRTEGKKLLIGDMPMVDVDEYKSLRQILKNIKSEQKQAFSEFMQENPRFKDLKEREDLYLFKDISDSDFYKYYNLTQEIEDKSVEINQCRDDNQKKKLNSRLRQLKKDRGSLINAADKRTAKYFQTYKEFAKTYRKISQQHGKILAQIKGIEKEKIESQLLNYWAMILEDDNKYKIVLIPKEKVSQCKQKVTRTQYLRDGLKLYWFESFTFRSLRKLCFGNLENETNTNSFYPEIRKELGEKYYTEDREGRRHFIKSESDFKGNEQKKIQFYKDILETDYAKQMLSLPNKQVEDEIIKTNFSSLDEFTIALEKICYSRFVVVDRNIIEHLSDFNAQIFDIVSMDLNNQLNAQNKKEQYEHKDKIHTQIWKSFWTRDNEANGFDVRLNPEITITYRKPKQSRIDKYGRDSELFDENRNNRYLHPQYTLVTTISEHCNAPKKDLSFATDDEWKSVIDDFNKEINKKDIKFAFGIDNGEVELSTLGVYLPAFNRNSPDEIKEEIENVNKYGFQVLTINDLLYKERDINGKEKRIIVNPSYFLKEELYCRTFGKTAEDYREMFSTQFSERSLLTLDLSTAKVIDGYIVTNGDVSTLFNLWLRHAQRTIYELNDKAEQETAKKVFLKKSEELNDVERRKFIDYINNGKKTYEELPEEEKKCYVQWIYNLWNGNIESNEKFEKIKKEQRVGNYSHGVLFAICCIDDDIESITDVFDVKHIFKLRKDFYSIKSEEEIRGAIDQYNNNRTISNEELDLKLVIIKQALVANAIGVIDLLYKQYEKRFEGQGIIIKEGFNSKKVEEDREKFSGNIYRLLERKLYQKFQNYGLVPPIKNLLSFRGEGVKDDNKTDILQLGNICFVSASGTSQGCPICGENMSKNHGDKCDKCGFDIQDIKNVMHSNDGIAGYNIAKRGFNNLTNKNR